MNLIAAAIQQREAKEQSEEQARRAKLWEQLAEIAVRDLAGKLTDDDAPTAAEIADELGLKQQGYDQLRQTVQLVRDLDAQFLEHQEMADSLPEIKASLRLAEHLAKSLVAAAKRRQVAAEKASRHAGAAAHKLLELRAKHPSLFADEGCPKPEVRQLAGYQASAEPSTKDCKLCGAKFVVSEFPGLCSRDCWCFIRDHGDDLQLLNKMSKPLTAKLLAREEPEQPTTKKPKK